MPNPNLLNEFVVYPSRVARPEPSDIERYDEILVQIDEAVRTIKCAKHQLGLCKGRTSDKRHLGRLLNVCTDALTHAYTDVQGTRASILADAEAEAVERENAE